jgi:N-acetylglutamate synthase-like GNAT family acetyltransferase
MGSLLDQPFTVRQATKADIRAIRSLVIAGHINPSNLDWKRFVVACQPNGEVIGCGQIKPHRDGSWEMASIAVKRAWRGKGVARAIISSLLGAHDGDLYLMCRSSLMRLYENYGFRVIDEDQMPRYFRKVKKLARLAELLTREGETLLVMKRAV